MKSHNLNSLHATKHSPLSFNQGIACRAFAFLVTDVNLRSQGGPACAPNTQSANPMSKSLFALIAVAFTLATSGIAVAQHSGASTVIQTISSPELAQIFKDEGYSYLVDSDGDIRWKIDGVKTLVVRSEKGNQLSFSVSFDVDRNLAEKVNEWNKSKRFSRSYLDKEGDPVLQCDLELDGGITRARVADFLKTCRVSLSAWTKEVTQ